jgi:hypothetical protein
MPNGGWMRPHLPGILTARTSLRRLENCEGHVHERLSWDANPPEPPELGYLLL